MTTSYKSGADLFDSWSSEVYQGEPPLRFRVPSPFDTLDIRPGRLILIGGAPGSGKTASLLQVGIDLLRGNESARLLIANVEMSANLLMNRIASRLAGIPLSAITDRTISAGELDRLKPAVECLRTLCARLAFLNSPYSLENVAAASTAFKANLMIIDYIQRFRMGDASMPQREQLEAATTMLRGFCDIGAAVLVASAVARQKGTRGSNYEGLNLASFRGSSELEFGADSAYLMSVQNGDTVFRGEKNRYGAVKDIVTRFEPITQKFVSLPYGMNGFDVALPAPTRASQRKDR